MKWQSRAGLLPDWQWKPLSSCVFISHLPVISRVTRLMIRKIQTETSMGCGARSIPGGGGLRNKPSLICDHNMPIYSEHSCGEGRMEGGRNTPLCGADTCDPFDETFVCDGGKLWLHSPLPTLRLTFRDRLNGYPFADWRELRFIRFTPSVPLTFPITSFDRHTFILSISRLFF